MGVKKLKPTSPGRRFQTVSDFASVTKTKPEKSLLAKQKRSSGRNSYGRTTSRHRGGGHKRRYRIVDFRRNKDGVPAKVAAIEYDPNRNARLALLHYVDGEKPRGSPHSRLDIVLPAVWRMRPPDTSRGISLGAGWRSAKR